MKMNFKHASFWAVIGRTILYSIPIAIVLALLNFALHSIPIISTIIALLLSSVSYFANYLAIRGHMRKHDYSWEALKGSTQVQRSECLPLLTLLVPIFIVAITMIYPIMWAITSSPTVVELLGPLFQLLDWIEQSNTSTWEFLILVVIFAPLFEELFFRGFLLNSWGERMSHRWAIFWSTLLFTVLHIPALLLPQFLLSLACSLIYIRTKKVVYPILFHALYNFLLVLPILFSNLNNTDSAGYVDLLYPTVQMRQYYFIASIIFIIALMVTIFVLKRYGLHINEEPLPYPKNFPRAPDVNARYNHYTQDELTNLYLSNKLAKDCYDLYDLGDFDHDQFLNDQQQKENQL